MQDTERNEIVWQITKSDVNVIEVAARILALHGGADRVVAEEILKRHLTEQQILDAWEMAKSIPGSVEAEVLDDELEVRPDRCPEGKTKAAILRCSYNANKQDPCPHCGKRSEKL